MGSDDQNEIGLGEMWDWAGEDYCLEKDSHNDLSRFLWDEVNQNELFCMLDEQTPVKDCTDLEHESLCFIGDKKRFSEDSRDSAQFKRRRMLKFNRDNSEANFTSEQMNSKVFKSKVMECSITEAKTSEWDGDWPFSFQDDICALTCDEDDSSDGWLTDCLNENAIRWSFEGIKNEVVVNKQADISDYSDNSLEMVPHIVQKTPPSASLKVSKGKKTSINRPRKLTDSVVYPFDLIKPCGVHGDVTLNDINQRIQAPPPSSLKHKCDEDPSIAFPMSAFSGKPVVVKTKIRTEGGQGSITIMRTKG